MASQPDEQNTLIVKCELDSTTPITRNGDGKCANVLELIVSVTLV